MRNKFTCLVLGLLGIHFPSVVLAESSSSRALEEIVVTARKRAESLQDVPIALTAFDENYIKDNAIGSIEDLVSIVPAFVAGQGNGSSGGAIYLRGVGSSTGNGLIDQSVAINIDGVAMAQAHLMFVGQYDVAQIEVLRGPQSLFFGKNSTGGVVSFTTNDPGDEFTYELGGGYEVEAEEKYGSIMLSGPLSETVGARIFARYGSQEGYYDIVTLAAPLDISDAAALFGRAGFLLGNNPALPSTADNVPEATDTFVRGTLVYEPNNAFDARFKFTYSDREWDSMPQFWQRTLCPLGSPQFRGIPMSVLSPGMNIDDCKFDRDVVTGDTSPAQRAQFAEFGLPPTSNGYKRTEVSLVSLELNYAWENGLTATSITGLYQVDDIHFLEQSNLPSAPIATAHSTDLDQLSQEFRLASDWDGSLNFMLGVFFETRETTNGGALPLIRRRAAFHEQDQDAFSAFGELIWDVSDQMEVSAGVRYMDEEKKIVKTVVNGVSAPFILPGGDELSSDNLIPELTVSYRPTDDLMVYGSYKEGVKSGGFDAGALNSLTQALGEARYDDETVDGFEVGVKAFFLDQTLQVNATAFSYDYVNMQVTSFDSNTLSVVTVNSDGADVDGFEVDFMWNPADIDGLTIRGAAAFVDSSYKDFISNCWTGQSQAAGCNVDVIPGGNPEGMDLSGQELMRAPEISANVGFSYQRTIMNGNLLLGIGGDVSYVDSYDNMQQGQPGTRQPSYSKVNASVSVSSADDTWTVALIGRNLNDEILRGIGQSVPLTGSGTGTVGAVPSDSFNLMSERGREIVLQFTIRPGLFGK
jgi:outer membrane receptor protein involved in Fe transport